MLVRPPTTYNREDPLVTVVPSLLRQVQGPSQPSTPVPILKHLTYINLDLDTLIPPCFQDVNTLIHIAFISDPQLGDHALEKITKDYMDLEGEESDEEDTPVMDAEIDEEEPVDQMDADDEEDTDVQILDDPLAIFQTPGKKKKKTLKVREGLDDNFLRHSKRLSIKSRGFKDAESARKNKAPAQNTNEEDIVEANPLAIIPPEKPSSGPAPHLPKEVLTGIAEGFLQIQPQSVSAALLEADDLDD